MKEEEDEARKIKSIGSRLINREVRACNNRHSSDMGVRSFDVELQRKYSKTIRHTHNQF